MSEARRAEGKKPVRTAKKSIAAEFERSSRNLTFTPLSDWWAPGVERRPSESVQQDLLNFLRSL